MLAYYADQKMLDLVRTCDVTNGCQQTLDEKLLVERAAHEKFELIPDSECKVDPVGLNENEQIVVSACALYLPAKGNQPALAKQFHEIARLVLTARLFAIGLELERSMDLATRSIRNLSSMEILTRVIGLESGVFNARSLSLSSDGVVWNVLSIEGKNETVNITEKLETKINCAKGPLERLRILDLKSTVLTTNMGLLEAPLEWVCSGQAWNAKAQIFFQAEQSEVVEKSVKIQIVGKRAL